MGAIALLPSPSHASSERPLPTTTPGGAAGREVWGGGCSTRIYHKMAGKTENKKR